MIKAKDRSYQTNTGKQINSTQRQQTIIWRSKSITFIGYKLLNVDILVSRASYLRYLKEKATWGRGWDVDCDGHNTIQIYAIATLICVTGQVYRLIISSKRPEETIDRKVNNIDKNDKFYRNQVFINI